LQTVLGGGYIFYSLYIQNFHCWLTHAPAVACGSLLQHCQ